MSPRWLDGPAGWYPLPLLQELSGHAHKLGMGVAWGFEDEGVVKVVAVCVLNVHGLSQHI